MHLNLEAYLIVWRNHTKHKAKYKCINMIKTKPVHKKRISIVFWNEMKTYITDGLENSVVAVCWSLLLLRITAPTCKQRRHKVKQQWLQCLLKTTVKLIGIHVSKIISYRYWYLCKSKNSFYCFHMIIPLLKMIS